MILCDECNVCIKDPKALWNFQLSNSNIYTPPSPINGFFSVYDHMARLVRWELTKEYVGRGSADIMMMFDQVSYEYMHVLESLLAWSSSESFCIVAIHAPERHVCTVIFVFRTTISATKGEKPHSVTAVNFLHKQFVSSSEFVCNIVYSCVYY